MSRSRLFEEVKIGSQVVVKSTKPSSAERRNKSKIDSLRKQLKATQAAIEQQEKQCQHRVKYDTYGVPYDVRHCWICGTIDGLI